ncbi:membrane-bound alkaline phosphatase-like [Aphidius gifuensis]|uniref:membrane-bound alkaline phosphatase-like n=1 Tax=Aphidius gifuensis TaxID=684658 RepID=UPI001CDB4C89|nr:membrane-bound alkaline phosphatase-like [Aphidius gifuensis]
MPCRYTEAHEQDRVLPITPENQIVVQHDGHSHEQTRNNQHTPFINKRVINKNEKKHGWSQEELETSYWINDAEKTLKKKLENKINTNKAKNIIFYLGDGMSIPTLTAARIYQGQLEGKSGEEGQLFWEQFPYSGLSKTWCLDKQVADSACTSTAYMCGVKTKYATLGINGHVEFGVCSTQLNKTNHVNSILKLAQDQGRSAGIVTTMRVTHASPAGAYAHSAHRDWESDHDIKKYLKENYTQECMDIATQLITQDPGNKFSVIMGGGRQKFLPNGTMDEENREGQRQDNINLIKEWKKDKANRGLNYLYGWNKAMIDEINRHPERYDSVLGLFESTNMKFHLEASPNTEPTLTEMTEAAIKILSKNKEGFVLFVEGGLIDHAHHSNYATIALDETVEFAKAVKAGYEATSQDDTLIVVTADHSHTMSIAGYPKRGNKIQGINFNEDGLPYSTLNYAIGPGYKQSNEHITQNETDNIRFKFPSLIKRKEGTHGGDDVAIFSSGPWAHLFTGSIEQSLIPHLLAHAACLTPDSHCSNIST